jgi:hypothetical protein
MTTITILEDLMTRRHVGSALALAALVVTLAACGASASVSGPASGSPKAPSAGASSGSTSNPAPAATEINPPGDIPDNQAFVTYRGVSGAYAVAVPEGWASTVNADATVFTDKFNSVRVAESKAPSAPTVATATSTQVAQLQASVPSFALGKVEAFTRAGGSGVLITYLADSPRDPVTDKVVRDAVEAYLFWKNGTLVTLTLIGPQNADNVDPWAKVTGSFGWAA